MVLSREVGANADVTVRRERFVLLGRVGASIASAVSLLTLSMVTEWYIPASVLCSGFGIFFTWFGKPWGLAGPRGTPRVLAMVLALSGMFVASLARTEGISLLCGLLAFAVFLQQSSRRQVASLAQFLLSFVYFGALAVMAEVAFSRLESGQILIPDSAAVALLAVSGMLVDLPRGPGRFIACENPAGIGMRQLVPLAMALPVVCVGVGLAGLGMGLFEQPGVILVLMVIPAMALVIAIWMSSIAIHALALVQRRVQAKLRRKSLSLEVSVAESTEELRLLNEDLKRARDLAEDRSRLMQRVFDTMENYVGVLTPDGTLLQCNRSALEVSGLTSADVVGKPFSTIKWWSHDPGVVRKVEEMIRRGAMGERLHQEVQYADASGLLRTSDMVMSPLFGEDGKVEYLVPSGADVTVRREFEDQLVRSRVDAEIANRAKSAFLAHMSHELRSPLGIILGFIDLAMEDKDDNAKSKHLETIKRNAQQLLALVDEVLDLGKIESGKISIDIEDVWLDKLVEEIEGSLQIKARERGVALSFSIAPDTPLALRTDPLRLKQILRNVVGNALKYTEKGSVSCEVRCVSQSAGHPEMIEFRVTDTGIGIPAEDVGRLFFPFSRGQQKKYSGTGLGLVLSRRLARLLGGDVILERSDPGKGSTFTASIIASRKVDPGLAGYSAHEMGIENVPESAGKLSGMRILVVDDVADNRLLISRYLEVAGASVATAAGGGEAVTMALQDGYDVVLMDLSMPDMSGQEATEAMRKEGYRIPIVALTAHAMREEKEKALNHGFNDYLTKPIVRDVLIDAIARIHDAVKKSA